MPTTPVTVNDLLPALEPAGKLLIFVVAAFLGMVTHWAKKAYKDKSGHTLYHWYGTNLASTLMVLSSLLAVIWTSLNGLDLANTGIYQLVTMAFTAGYTCDSAFNSAEVKNENK